MDKEKVLELKRLNNEGKTAKELAAHFGISMATVHYWKTRLRKAGHEVVRNKSKGNGGVKIEL